MAGHQGRLATCVAKCAFSDYQTASMVAQQMRRRGRRRIISYRCRWCQSWHVGTNGRRKLRNKDDEETRDFDD